MSLPRELLVSLKDVPMIAHNGEVLRESPRHR